MKLSSQQPNLHIIHGLTVGGAEVDLITKSIALVQRYEYDVTICCLMRRGEFASHAEAAGIRVVGPLMRHRYDVLAGRHLRRVLLAEPWPLVHTHLFAANFVGCAVAMTLPPSRRPLLVASEHAMAERWGRLPLLVDRLFQRYVALMLVPSQASAASYVARGLQGQRLRVIPNAIDVRRFKNVNRAAARFQIRQQLSVPQDAYLIGTVCRLEVVKGLPILLKAVESLPAYLVIAGEGPQRSYLASIVRAHGLGDRVQLLGSRSDVPELLAAVDLFVLPSYSESFGIAVAEALLAKTPVVATNVGGIPEVTDGGKYARLVAPGDVDALTEGIRWMMDHLEQAQAQACQGHTFVSDVMSLEAVATKQHAIYQQLLSQEL